MRGPRSLESFNSLPPFICIREAFQGRKGTKIKSVITLEKLIFYLKVQLKKDLPFVSKINFDL